MPSNRDLALLKAFESVLSEGRFLDESIGTVLDTALRFFDAVAVALQPAGGAPSISRAGTSIVATAAEQKLARVLEGLLADGREKRVVESGLIFVCAPVKVGDHVSGAFGVSLPLSSGKGVDVDEGIRSFAQVFGRILERERSVATLVKRREEAVALFELASGALHTLNADEVVRLTAASLQRQLEFDQVQAYRYHAEQKEIEHILGQGTSPGSAGGFVPGQRRSIDDDGILVRSLAAHGPAFDDDDTDADDSKGPRRRRRLAIPLEYGETVFGFLTMSRRGAFVLTPQEMRLVQELARLAAGAIEKARLVDAERRNAERVAFVNRVHAALGGLTELEAILDRTVQEIGSHFDLDLCAVQLHPLDQLPGPSAFCWKGGIAHGRGRDEVPQALFELLSAEGSYALLPDVAAGENGLDLVPAPEAAKDLPRPLSIVAVPLASRGEIVGVLVGLGAGRPWVFGPPMLRSFQALAVEVSLAVTSARLLQRERDSYRFLDRLREVGRSFTTTFDGSRIKHTLCEQAVALLSGTSAQFWDADAQTKSLRVLAHWGGDGSSEGLRAIPTESSDHPVVRAWLEKTLVLVDEKEIATLYPAVSAGSGQGNLRAAAVPLLYQDEQIGVLTFAFRSLGQAWPSALGGRLSLLADAAAVALHNSRLMKIIEQQTERDGVTGLYNQGAILRRLESELRRAERSGQPLSVAHLCVDGLAEAGRRFGVPYGDSLLPKVAAQLVRATRSVNIVGRGKGDRFWILIFEAGKVTGQRAAEAIQKNFTSAFDPRLEATGMKFSLTIGLAAYPEDAFDTASLLSRAEEALDDAVRRGPGTISLYGALAEADLGDGF
ncbi:MAG TPA: diguanylate cyclase [Thermoanaerobaculia bacterium]|nr:diguanylate cyclase [Thermoanaerobaculia bacterium]